jgi:quinol monooxygenase YgiN
MFGLSVRFTCKDTASAKAFDAMVAEMVPQIRQHEPGTLIYAVHEVEGKPLERIFYELYRDRVAFDAHEEQPYVRHFLAARDKFLTGRKVDRLSLLAGKGTDG